MQKLIEGLIKFYIVYMVFGAMAMVIIYASADLRCFIQTGESFLSMLVKSSGSLTEERIARKVIELFSIALKSVPGDTFFNTVMGISIDSNVISSTISFVLGLFRSGETRAALLEGIRNYDLFWRDMAVVTSSSFVIYAVVHLKEKVAGKGISIQLGFALSSVFWIFAGYSFAETVVYALELCVLQGNLTALYIIIMLTAVFLEAGIHAFGKRCLVSRLIVLFFVKIFLNLLRNAFALYMCCVFVSFFDIMSVSDLTNALFNVLFLILSAAIIICSFLAEAKLRHWSEETIKDK